MFTYGCPVIGVAFCDAHVRRITVSMACSRDLRAGCRGDEGSAQVFISTIAGPPATCYDRPRPRLLRSDGVFPEFHSVVAPPKESPVVCSGYCRALRALRRARRPAI